MGLTPHHYYIQCNDNIKENNCNHYIMLYFVDNLLFFFGSADGDIGSQ